MKIQFLIFSLLLCITSSILGQEAVHFYVGNNFSIFHKREYQGANLIDKRLKQTLLMPSLGFDVEWKLNEKTSIASGLGLHFFGVANFNLKNDSLLKDTKLKIGYFSVPLRGIYKINTKLAIIGAYSLNYSFRKNQNFLYTDFNNPDFNIHNSYANYVHFVQIGAKYYFTPKFFTQCSYSYALNNISTANNNLGETLQFQAIQLMIGYTIQQPQAVKNKESKKKKKHK